MFLEESYLLESIDQLKAVADELRQRIIHALAEPITVTRLGDVLGVPPANLRYHVRELERLGLVRLVEIREQSGILEKYYQRRARTLVVPPSLFSRPSPDQAMSAVYGLLQDLTRGFMAAFSQRVAGRIPTTSSGVTRWHLWMTDEEVKSLQDEVAALVERYERPRDVPGEREQSFVAMHYDPRAGAGHEAAEAGIVLQAPDDALEDFTTPGRAARLNLQRGDLLRTWVAGITTYRKHDLERAIDHGKELDIASIGHVTFEDDIPADLVDRAIARFRHSGSVSASPAVREVLAGKGGETDTTP